MKLYQNILVVLVLATLSVQGLSAQTFPDRKDVRKGNRDFKKGNYKEAEIDYRKALVKDSTSFAANYNLGNALYKLNDFQQAGNSYKSMEAAAAGKPEASDLFYNMGNVSVQGKDWQAAVDAYKKSLLLNPNDLDAKENYLYAKKMLENQQQNENQDNQQDNQHDNQQDNKDQNQNNQNDQNQNSRDDQEQQKSNQENQQDNKNDSQPQQGDAKISPQAAQQLLQAIQAKEKETQEKVNKEKVQALKSRQKDKNW